MHRIDGPAAAPGGVFTEGDPNVGTPATVVTDDWLNAVQTEIESAITGAGYALAKPDNTQLLQAIKKLASGYAPVGQVVWGYFAAAPANFLLCNGQVVSRAAYPVLWAHANGGGLVVAEATWSATSWTMFGAGDGATTFRLPDLRAEFLRGADLGRGIDAARTVGSWQADELKSHTHGGVPSFTGDIDRGDQSSSFSVDNTGTTASTGGAETRPRNVALTACIRC